MEIERRLFL